MGWHRIMRLVRAEAARVGGPPAGSRLSYVVGGRNVYPPPASLCDRGPPNCAACDCREHDYRAGALVL